MTVILSKNISNHSSKKWGCGPEFFLSDAKKPSNGTLSASNYPLNSGNYNSSEWNYNLSSGNYNSSKWNYNLSEWNYNSSE